MCYVDLQVFICFRCTYDLDGSFVVQCLEHDNNSTRSNYTTELEVFSEDIPHAVL